MRDTASVAGQDMTGSATAPIFGEPYWGGGFRDFLRRTGLDGMEEFKGTDIWSMRHLLRAQDEQKRGRAIELSLEACLSASDPEFAESEQDNGEDFLRDHLAPALRTAISNDRYLIVRIDTTRLPTEDFLRASFGGLARTSEGFSPEDLTERLAATFANSDSRWLGRAAIDNLHFELERRLRAEGYVRTALAEW